MPKAKERVKESEFGKLAFKLYGKEYCDLDENQIREVLRYAKVYRK